MPIRVVKDEGQEEQQGPPSGRRGAGGGGGGLGSLLPMLLGMFGKNPKLLIIVVIIGAALYFFKGGCNMGTLAEQLPKIFNTGANLDPKQFDETEVFEPLAAGANTLPERVSLEQYCPPRLDQGQQGSCVAWSHAYAARTIMYAMQSDKDPKECTFSPSFLYNQIKLDGCQGSYIPRAMEKMQSQGLVPFDDFPYNDQDCNTQPGESLKQKAASYTIKGFQRLTVGDASGFGSEKIDMQAIKQNLAQGAPVTIGMMVGGSFMQGMVGREVWIPNDDDYNMMNFGGHAMCIIGYDDYKEGGAFQIMNSWGPDWGKNGIAWVRYKDFMFFNKEAYGLYPMGNADDTRFAEGHLQASFGLVDNDTKSNIALAKSSGMSVKAVNPLKKGISKFKIQVKNDAECYTYVYGLELDNTVKGLFPYTGKHSPYCGIMGTRLFPKDYSLQPDEQGSTDYFAIIVSKKPVDFEAVRGQLSSAPGGLEQKLKSVFGDRLKNVSYEVSETVSFNLENGGDDPVVAIVIEVPKAS